MLVAQDLIVPGATGTVHGPLSSKFTNIASVVNNAVPVLFAISGIALFIYLVWGGFDYLTSLGEPKKAESGKNRITAAVVGFILLFSAFWILQLVDFVFGFKIF